LASLKEILAAAGRRVESRRIRDDLAAFETKYHVHLPSDLRDYFAAVNGFGGSGFGTDGEGITFLGLDEVKPLSEYWSPDVPDADDYFVLADFDISAHVYAIRLLNNSGHGNPVVVVYDGRPVEVAGSSRSLLKATLRIITRSCSPTRRPNNGMHPTRISMDVVRKVG
jgi:hypothetical protein